MTALQTILKFLDGKKTLIVGILSAVVVYLTSKNIFGMDEALLAETIITLLGGGASLATKALFTTTPNEVK